MKAVFLFLSISFTVYSQPFQLIFKQEVETINTHIHSYSQYLEAKKKQTKRFKERGTKDLEFKRLNPRITAKRYLGTQIIESVNKVDEFVHILYPLLDELEICDVQPDKMIYSIIEKIKAQPNFKRIKREQQVRRVIDTFIYPFEDKFELLIKKYSSGTYQVFIKELN